MRQLKFKGFTLIELLIVVAIIAILAAIAVPNFLEAQIRSKVSRAKTDMRTIATALEAYFVDSNTYVGSAQDTGQQGTTINGMLTPAPSTNTSAAVNASARITFTTYMPQLPEGQAGSLTTPVAYLTTLPPDPFADTKGAIFGYFNASDAGWIAWSYGPDTDEKTGNGEIQSHLVDATTAPWSSGTPAVKDYTADSVYNPYTSNPTAALRTAGAPDGRAYTYDPTNGTNSTGDVWRTKE